MHMIQARNVNDAYREGISLIRAAGRAQKSRAGAVLAVLEPVTTYYYRPVERILWDTVRDCNPFFHLYESIWMLDGRNDVAGLARYNKKMVSFSDDKVHFHGAYGHRWRSHWPTDQLSKVIRMLANDPSSRRVVLQMWDPETDLDVDGLDLPCNLCVKFKITNGFLDMVVFNRSNDMIWGAYGANYVHFSFLQEYVAGLLGVSVGNYWQISSDFHVYEEVWTQKVVPGRELTPDRYQDEIGMMRIIPMNMAWNDHSRLSDVANNIRPSPGNPFFSMAYGLTTTVWNLWLAKDRAGALVALDEVEDCDWKVACREWMVRRVKS